ncbi:hypothetical protein BKA62DRAFT_196799 [Auriculariales sp. MPI-PUGE-AT-0066]|nr:hypothetical protein BKA62DRAFT_196799 [Auriculariales sp. MPI-PUGE-AT-0066]
MPAHYRRALNLIALLPEDWELARIRLIRRLLLLLLHRHSLYSWLTHHITSTWADAERDNDVTPSQLAAIGTSLGVRLGNGAYDDESRLVAGTILQRLLLVPPEQRSTIDRLRMATCALNVSIADRDNATWWPFLEWAGSELVEVKPGMDGSAKDRGEVGFAASQAYSTMISWLWNTDAVSTFLPLCGAVYENWFHDPYQAADILNEFARHAMLHDDTDTAARMLFQAFYLGRTGRALAPENEPAAGVCVRITNHLLHGLLFEVTDNHAHAQVAYKYAQLLIKQNPGLVPKGYIDAADSGLLRVRTATGKVALDPLPPDIDEDDWNH